MRIPLPILAAFLAAAVQVSHAAGGASVVATAIDAAGDVIVADNVDGAFRLIKYSGASGSPIWERRPPGGALDIAWGLALDPRGDVFLMGKAAGVSTEVWVAKHRGSNGSLAWQQPVDSGAETTPAGIATDGAGNAFIVGNYRNSSGDADWSVARLAGSSGAIVWRKIYDSGAADVANGIAVDVAGDVIVAGITAIAGGTVARTVKSAGATGRTLWERSFAELGVSLTGLNVQGLWWKDSSESGWGVNLTQQGDVLFATWFTYDDQGQGIWLVMSNGERVGDDSYAGTLYRTRGPAFDSVPFESAKVALTAVGAASFTFTDASNGVFRYAVNGVPGAKAITRQVFATPPTCALGLRNDGLPNYQDLWWSRGGAESGWGLNVAHQGDTLFITWFTYDSGGDGMWLVGSNVAKTGNATYAGTLYRTVGPPFDSAAWSASQVGVAPAGHATLVFSDDDNGTFTYTLDGVSQSKQITRQVFASPKTVCR